MAKRKNAPVVVGASIQGTMADIEATQAAPIGKREDSTETAGRDAQQVAKDIAGEIFTLAAAESRGAWLDVARKIIACTTDARIALVAELKAHKEKAMHAAVYLSGDDAASVSRAKKSANSATTRCSEMATIAKAFNAGGTVADMEEKYGANPALYLIYAYAKGIMSGQGGKAHISVLSGYVAFLNRQAKREDLTDTDKVTLKRLTDYAATFEGVRKD